MGTDLKEEVLEEFIFENILIPMPVVDFIPEDEGVLHPVTQADALLRDAGVSFVGLSEDEKGFRIDFAEGVSEEDKTEARQLLEGKTFEPRRPLTVQALADRLTEEQVSAALRHAAAREYFLSPELAKQLKVDVYVHPESTVPVGTDDQRLAEPVLQRR